jgi:hypothetical protein
MNSANPASIPNFRCSDGCATCEAAAARRAALPNPFTPTPEEAAARAADLVHRAKVKALYEGARIVRQCGRNPEANTIKYLVELGMRNLAHRARIGGHA